MFKRHIIATLSFILIIGVGTIYNPYHYYYGFVELVSLDQEEDKYVMEVSGDFGKRKGVFKGEERIGILEDEEIREESIVGIWPELEEGEDYHMLLEVHKRKGPFSIERINFDFSS